MIRFKKNLMKIPPGGWHYIEGTETIRGDDVKEVEKKIAQYRVQNGRPPGDPHQDMVNFWYSKDPYYIEKAPDSEEKEQVSPDTQLGSILQWLQRIIHQGSDLEVGRGVIEERSSVCIGCPFNIPISGDPVIKEEIDRRSFMIRRGEVMPSLHFCGHHLYDLRVAVRVRSELLPLGPSSPAHCWVKPGIHSRAGQV